MRMLDGLRRTAAGLLLERPARKVSFAQFAERLEATGRAVEERAMAAKDSERTQKVLRHISGIERWGQRRLLAFLGQAVPTDEYDDYRPATTLTTAEQNAFFRTTRQQTVILARQLEQANVPDTALVPHNELGPLTARAWLYYLNMHASLESKKIK